jgi:hypothetical protein
MNPTHHSSFLSNIDSCENRFHSPCSSSRGYGSGLDLFDQYGGDGDFLAELVIPKRKQEQGADRNLVVSAGNPQIKMFLRVYRTVSRNYGLARGSLDSTIRTVVE